MPHHKPQSYSTPANNPSIQPLSTSIISQIRSTINIVSPSCVLRELVQNSIDAKASRVDIWVMEEGQKLMVVDDGEGVGKEDIKSLGGRYATSKAYDQSSLNILSTFGFRGEAIASIAGMSEIKIISRSPTSEETYCKTIKGGKVIEFGKTRRQHKVNPGTTITVSNLFYNIPARRTASSSSSSSAPTFSPKLLKKTLEIIVLGIPPERKPGVMITMTEEGGFGGRKIFEVRGGGGGWVGSRGGQKGAGGEVLVDTFGQMFGRDELQHVRRINARAKVEENGDVGMKVAGFISLQDHRSKAHQYIYLNGFHLDRCELHDLIDGWMAKTSLGRDDDDFAPGRVKLLTPRYGLFPSLFPHSSRTPKTSPPTGKQPYRKRRTPQPIYVLQVNIRPSQVDMAVDPKKNQAFVQDWTALKGFLDNVMSDALREACLLPSSQQLMPAVTQLNKNLTQQRPNLPASGGSMRIEAKSVVEVDSRLTLESSRTQKSKENHAQSQADGALPSTPPIPTRTTRHKSILREPSHLARDWNLRCPFSVGCGQTEVEGAAGTGQLARGDGSETGRPFWLDEILANTTRSRSYTSALPSASIADISQPFTSVKAARLPFQRESETIHDFDPLGARITKAQLRRAEVIAQVDRKFILCHIPGDRIEPGLQAIGMKAQTSSGSETCLIIIDQHAAHERIRVERFISELCNGFIEDDVRVVDLGDEPHEIPVGEMELGFLRGCGGVLRLLRRWGIGCEIGERVDGSGGMRGDDDHFDGDSIFFGPHDDDKPNESASKPIITVHTVPKILENRLATASHKEVKRVLKEYIGALMEIENLDRGIDRFFESLDGGKVGSENTTAMQEDDTFQEVEMDDNGGKERKIDWRVVLRWCPERMIDLLNSNACRGAIMFNDPLILPRCQELIDELALTDYPFMCAHGRQSVSVLCKLGEGFGVGVEDTYKAGVVEALRCRQRK